QVAVVLGPVCGDFGDRRRAVAGEPRGGLCAIGDATGEGDLGGSFPQLYLRRCAVVGEVFVGDAVCTVGIPVELLLRGDHLGPQGGRRRLGIGEQFQSGDDIPKNGRRLSRSMLRRKSIHSPTKAGEVSLGEWKVLEGSAGELVVPRPRLVYHSARRRSGRLVVAVLLEPEQGRGRIEHAKQVQVLLFAGPLRQLDHRRGLLEHLPAPVEYEVVVRGDEGEGDNQRRGVAFADPSVPGPPGACLALGNASKSCDTSKTRPKRPLSAEPGRLFVERNRVRRLVIWSERPCFRREIPISDAFAAHNGTLEAHILHRPSQLRRHTEESLIVSWKTRAPDIS